MSFVDKFVAEILTLQVALYHTYARLEARTDSEALHDLRIAVRRIRSLLRPLRSMNEVIALNNAAAEVGRLTTPARDLEVMIQELEEKGFFREAQIRKVRLASGHVEIVESPSIKKLLIQMDDWSSAFRLAELNGGLKHIQPQIEKTLKKQIDRLHAAVDDSGFDRHELRILVKRTRYLTDAFTKLSPLSREAPSSLKALQSALGSWHDHYQWCQKALVETDLIRLKQVWLTSAASALEKAEAQLLGLSKLGQFAVGANTIGTIPLGSPGGLPAPTYHEMVYGVASGENEKNSLIQLASFPYGNDDTSGEASSEYLTKVKYDSGKTTPSNLFCTCVIVSPSTEEPCSTPKELQSNFMSDSRAVNNSAPPFLGDGGSVQVYGSLSFRRGNFRTLSRYTPIHQAKR